jgi:hypothetical protein
LQLENTTSSKNCLSYPNNQKRLKGQTWKPVSLHSVFDKILEKLMFKLLYGFLTKRKILYDYQFGFRSGHSTSLALIELPDAMYSHCDKNEIVLGMYFDLRKAFGTIDHSILLYKLKNYGVRGFTLNWFEDYLSNRKQFVSIANAVLKSVKCTKYLGVLIYSELTWKD